MFWRSKNLFLEELQYLKLEYGGFLQNFTFSIFYFPLYLL
jgi:hypothetical protein